MPFISLLTEALQYQNYLWIHFHHHVHLHPHFLLLLLLLLPHHHLLLPHHLLVLDHFHLLIIFFFLLVLRIYSRSIINSTEYSSTPGHHHNLSFFLLHEFHLNWKQYFCYKLNHCHQEHHHEHLHFSLYSQYAIPLTGLGKLSNKHDILLSCSNVVFI